MKRRKSRARVLLTIYWPWSIYYPSLPPSPPSPPHFLRKDISSLKHLLNLSPLSVFSAAVSMIFFFFFFFLFFFFHFFTIDSFLHPWHLTVDILPFDIWPSRLTHVSHNRRFEDLRTFHWSLWQQLQQKELGYISNPMSRSIMPKFSRYSLLHRKTSSLETHLKPYVDEHHGEIIQIQLIPSYNWFYLRNFKSKSIMPKSSIWSPITTSRNH